MLTHNAEAWHLLFLSSPPPPLSWRRGCFRTMQIFNTLDPYPLAGRALDPAAEDYLLAWAKELPDRRPLRSIPILVICFKLAKIMSST